MRRRHTIIALAVLAPLLLSAVACGGQTSSDVGASPSAAPTDSLPAAPTSSLPVAPTDGLPAASTDTLSAPTDGLSATPTTAPPLEGLLNPDDTPFSLADMAGSATLVFFGYTHCPDICPATIGEIFGVFQAQPEAQAVFVSVDPERDSTEFLAQWTEYFPENFHAVTGSPGTIRRAADGYGVKYARVETSSRSGYTMSHTANVYLIDGQGQLRRTYPFGTPAAQMAADIETLQAG